MGALREKDVWDVGDVELVEDLRDCLPVGSDFRSDLCLAFRLMFRLDGGTLPILVNVHERLTAMLARLFKKPEVAAAFPKPPSTETFKFPDGPVSQRVFSLYGRLFCMGRVSYRLLAVLWHSRPVGLTLIDAVEAVYEPGKRRSTKAIRSAALRLSEALNRQGFPHYVHVDHGRVKLVEPNPSKPLLRI